jgi:Tol biopolymer transport system component
MKKAILIGSMVIGVMGNMSVLGEEEMKGKVSVQYWEVVRVHGRIVFQSNRDGAMSEIWIVEEGRLRKLASSTNTFPKEIPNQLSPLFESSLGNLREPKWSPDGSKILCVGKGEITTLHPSTGEVLEKIQTRKHVSHAIWSSDEEGIYYESVDEKPGGGGSDNIYRLSLEDGSERQITDLLPMPGIRSIISLAVSPDESLLAFTMVGEKEHGISIWSVKTDGTDLKLLVKYAGDPKFSPSGSRLAYASRHGPDGKRISEFDEIFILDLKTMQTTRVTHNKWTDRDPVFSPDGTQIAYKSTRHREIAHGSEIFVINTDGTGEARVTPVHVNPKHLLDSLRGWATDERPDWTR